MATPKPHVPVVDGGAGPGQSTARVARDVRVDSIGFAAEVAKRLGDDVKSDLKVRMVGAGLERVAGDYYQGLLVTPGPTGVVDPSKFLRLLERGKITRAEFVAAVTVSTTAAAKLLGSRGLDAVSDRKPPASPRLMVSRLEGLEPTILDAVKSLLESVRVRA